MVKPVKEDLFNDITKYNSHIFDISKETLQTQQEKSSDLKEAIRLKGISIKVHTTALRSIKRNIRLIEKDKTSVLRRETLESASDFEMAFGMLPDSYIDFMADVSDELKHIEKQLRDLRQSKTAEEQAIAKLKEERDTLYLKLGLCRRLMYDCKQNLGKARSRIDN